MSNENKKEEAEARYNLVESNHKGFHFYASTDGEVAIVNVKSQKILVIKEGKIFIGYQNVKEYLSDEEKIKKTEYYKSIGFDDEFIRQSVNSEHNIKRVRNVLDISELTDVIANEEATWKDKKHAMNFIVKKATKMIKKGWF